MKRHKHCVECGEYFERPADYSHKMWANRKYCCHECYQKVVKRTHGTNWNGGVATHAEGYKMIRKPNHNTYNKCNYVMEHRLVMEEHIGRKLYKNEVVHHINGDRSDNRIENLMLFNDRKAHNEYHTKMGIIEDYGEPIDPTPEEMEEILSKL